MTIYKMQDKLMWNSILKSLIVGYLGYATKVMKFWIFGALLQEEVTLMQHVNQYVFMVIVFVFPFYILRKLAVNY